MVPTRPRSADARFATVRAVVALPLASRHMMSVGARVVALAAAVLSLARILQSTRWGENEIDFYPYWSAARVVLQGQDPYSAFVAQLLPLLPGKSIAPANTAPLVLLLTPLALLPLAPAETIWLVVNLILAAAIPWIVFYVFRLRMSFTARMCLSLDFLCWQSTRSAIENGQVTLLVCVLLLVTVWLARLNRDLLAGIALGIAMSKYSLALPGVLLFLAYRRYLILIVSAAIQLLGLLCITAVSGTSPVSIVTNYFVIMTMHLDNRGIHLEGLGMDATLARLLVLLVGVAMLMYSVRHSRGQLAHDDSAGGPPTVLRVLGVLIAGVLLVVYHREYDAALLFIPVAAVAADVFRGDRRTAEPAAPVLVGTLTLVCAVIFLSLPGRNAIPQVESWGQLRDILTAAAAVVLLGGTWLLSRRTASARQLKPLTNAI